MIQVMKSEYDEGVKFLIADLQYTVFDADNIRKAAKALLNSVSGSMVDSENVVFDLLRTMYYKSGKIDNLIKMK